MSSRFYLAASLSLALAALGAGCKKADTTAATPPPANVTVAKPVAKRLVEWDEFTGRLEAVASVEVRARVSGYLQQANFQEGSEVKEGDLLFVIDPRLYKAELEQAQAELARARAQLELTILEAERATKLVQNRTISQEESDAKVKARQGAEGTLKAAQASVDAAKLQLEWTNVTAPISGRVSRKLVTEGNLISGGTGATTLLTTIVSLDPIYCYFDVDERSALKYRDLAREGKRDSALKGSIPAQMGLANQDGFPHQGKIDFVDNVISPTTGAIRARGIFPNADRLMAPGFFARVRIPGSGEYDALLIRDSAIGSDQGRPFVYIVGADNKVVQRPINPGPLEDGLRVVRDGLKPDERIVVNGLMAVRPGATVNAQETAMVQPAATPAAATAAR